MLTRFTIGTSVGERLSARVIAVLERSGGDPKLLALPLDGRPELGWRVRTDLVPVCPAAKAGDALAREDTALALIRECRAAPDERP